MKKTLVFLFLFYSMILPCYLSAGNTLPIDLMKQDIYAARGFSPEWLNSVPRGEQWKKITPGESEKARLSVPELKIDGLPEKKWFSLKSHNPELVTFIIPFNFDIPERSGTAYGLFFAYIGGCWEVYLNGEMVRSEFHLDKNGGIDYTTNSRNVFIPLQSRLLRSGENILVVKILGDPTFVKTGLYQKWPNIISDVESLYGLHSEMLSLILISVYLFIGVYHLFLHMLWRSDKFNLYFGLLCMSLFFNQFARTSAIYNIITDTNTVNRIELFFLFGLLPLLGSFIEEVLSGSITRFTKGYGAIFVFLALLSLAAPMPFVYDLVQVWEKFIAVPILIYIVLIVVMNFKKSITGFNPLISAGSHGTVMKVIRSMVFTTSGRMLLALVVIAFCVVFDIILKRYYYIHLNPARFGFFILIVGTTLNLADNFISIHRRVESLNVSLGEKITDLNNAYEKISVSEEKYRMLVEGVSHYICTTDLEGNLLTANNKLIRDMRLDTDNLNKVNILDLFYMPEDDRHVTRRFISEKILETVTMKKQVSFKTQIKPYFQIEPREMTVYFEIVNISSAQEIMVKAYDAIEDSLLKNLVCEKQVLEMGNSLSVAEELSNRLVRNIERYYDPKKTNILRMALREMILNSIEHGNLDISYNTKSEMLDNDNYFEFIAQRQKDPVYRDRKVSIVYTLTPEKVVYVIRDEGSGFDYKDIIKNSLSTANDFMLAHGRGIAMTRNAFDEVKYNDKGNEVTLVKYFGATGDAVTGI